MRRWQQLVLLVLVPAVLVTAFVVARSIRDEPETAIEITAAADERDFDFDFSIPAGTADRLAAGDDVEIVPRELVAHVGDSIRIVNGDAVGHTVGVFYVGPHETLTQRFQSAGVLESECTVHPSGSVTLRVLE